MDLEGSDTLTATADGKTKTLSAVDPGIYEARFTGVSADSEFSVTLDRPEDETASDNSGTLPTPFALDEPESNLSRADDALDITWAPADTGDPVVLELDGDCIFNYDKKVSDTGKYTLAAGTLDSTNSKMPETCDITVQADRSRDGTADAKFDRESYFKLHQRRKATFTSAP